MKKDFILSIFFISILASGCGKEDIPESDYLEYTSNIDNSNQIKKKSNVDFISVPSNLIEENVVSKKDNDIQYTSSYYTEDSFEDLVENVDILEEDDSENINYDSENHKMDAEEYFAMKENNKEDTESNLEYSNPETFTENYITPIILDIDMSSDVDDVTAFRIAEELDYLGIIDIKGVAFSITPERSGNNLKAAEGLLDYAGLYDVPVADCSVDCLDYSDYWGILWQYKTTNHQIYNNATIMYKDILKSLPEGQKLRIVTTGFLTNIESLLKDSEGFNLVSNKVDGIFVAGGSDGLSWNLSYLTDVRNAASYVFSNCPVDLYLVQDALGANQVGGHLTQIDTLDEDVLSQCYREFGLSDGQNYGNCDGTAVYCAAYKDNNYNDLYKPIPIQLSIDSSNGSVTGIETTENTKRYRFIATKSLNSEGVFDKYILYSSSLYTNEMDKLIEGDYNRKH